ERGRRRLAAPLTPDPSPRGGGGVASRRGGRGGIDSRRGGGGGSETRSRGGGGGGCRGAAPLRGPGGGAAVPAPADTAGVFAAGGGPARRLVRDRAGIRYCAAGAPLALAAANPRGARDAPGGGSRNRQIAPGDRYCRPRLARRALAGRSRTQLQARQ